MLKKRDAEKNGCYERCVIYEYETHVHVNACTCILIFIHTYMQRVHARAWISFLPLQQESTILPLSLSHSIELQWQVKGVDEFR